MRHDDPASYPLLRQYVQAHIHAVLPEHYHTLTREEQIVVRQQCVEHLRAELAGRVLRRWADGHPPVSLVEVEAVRWVESETAWAMLREGGRVVGVDASRVLHEGVPACEHPTFRRYDDGSWSVG